MQGWFGLITVAKTRFSDVDYNCARKTLEATGSTTCYFILVFRYSKHSNDFKREKTNALLQRKKTISSYPGPAYGRRVNIIQCNCVSFTNNTTIDLRHYKCIYAKEYSKAPSCLVSKFFEYMKRLAPVHTNIEK